MIHKEYACYEGRVKKNPSMRRVPLNKLKTGITITIDGLPASGKKAIAALIVSALSAEKYRDSVKIIMRTKLEAA